MANRRVRELAAIHVRAKHLRMDRQTYEAMLQRMAGVSSAADLDERGRREVMAELARLGAPTGHPGRPHNADSRAMPEMITKIEAQLADMGLSWAYADAIVRRMHGIEKVAWCRKPEQLRSVIAALHVEQEKRHLGAAIDEGLAALGMTAAALVERVPALPDNWRRRRYTLRNVAALVAHWQGESDEHA